MGKGVCLDRPTPTAASGRGRSNDKYRNGGGNRVAAGFPDDGPNHPKDAEDVLKWMCEMAADGWFDGLDGPTASATGAVVTGLLGQTYGRNNLGSQYWIG